MERRAKVKRTYARRKDLLDNGQFSNNDLNNDGE